MLKNIIAHENYLHMSLNIDTTEEAIQTTQWSVSILHFSMSLLNKGIRVGATMRLEPHHFLAQVKNSSNLMKPAKTKSSEHACAVLCIATINRNNTYLTFLSPRTASCLLCPF